MRDDATLGEFLAIRCMATAAAILAGIGDLCADCSFVTALDRIRELLFLGLEHRRERLEFVKLLPYLGLGAGLSREIGHARARRKEIDNLAVERQKIVDRLLRRRLIRLALGVVGDRLEIVALTLHRVAAGLDLRLLVLGLRQDGDARRPDRGCRNSYQHMFCYAPHIL